MLRALKAVTLSRLKGMEYTLANQQQRKEM